MTMPDETQHRPRILISITSTQSEKLLKKCFDALRIPIFYQCRAQGTAPSEILDILGMRESARLITVSFLPRFSVPAVFEAMENELSVKRRGGGIVFTVPVTGIQTPIFSMLNEEAKEKIEKRIEGYEAKMKDTNKYTLIWISVAAGYGDDVVETAREIGVGGSTMLKGKRCGSEYAAEYLGITLQAEQDFVLIVIPKEKKADIMRTIGERYGLNTDAHGLVIAMPIDDIIGLRPEQ